MNPVRAWVTLGLMSGTSMDGIDACLAHIRLTETSFEFDIIDTAAIPFEKGLRQAIGRCPAGTVEDVARLHFHLGAAYADAAQLFLEGRPVDFGGRRSTKGWAISSSNTRSSTTPALLKRPSWS
ncbi:Anhydro-N-acetylmuramic acid kinase [subsurface metagenome]